jgi:hypothetical protein
VVNLIKMFNDTQSCLIFHFDVSLMISFFISKTFQFGLYSKFGLISLKLDLIQLVIEVYSYQLVILNNFDKLCTQFEYLMLI